MMSDISLMVLSSEPETTLSVMGEKSLFSAMGWSILLKPQKARDFFLAQNDNDSLNLPNGKSLYKRLLLLSTQQISYVSRI